MTSVSAMMLAGGAVTETFVAWNPLDKSANITLSNSNRDAACVASSFSAVRADRGFSAGKRYFEISLPSAPGSSRAGFGDSGFNLSSYVGNSAKSAGVLSAANTVNGFTQVFSGTTGTDTNGDYFMYAVDFALGYAWLGKNNSWFNSGNPAAGTGQWLSAVSGIIYPACSLYNGGSYRLCGNTSNIQGTVPSGFSVWGA